MVVFWGLEIKGLVIEIGQSGGEVLQHWQLQVTSRVG